MRKEKKLIHPGKELLSILNKNELSQAELARALMLNAATINKITSCKAGFTWNLDLRLSKVIGTEPGYWIGLTMDYDHKKNEAEIKAVLKELKTLKQFKVKKVKEASVKVAKER